MTVSKWYAPVLAALTLVSHLAAARPLSEPQDMVVPKGVKYGPMGYLEHLPAGYDDNQRSPLIIYLTGRREAGDGSRKDLLARAANSGPSHEIKEGRWSNDRPFIVLSPQHPSEDVRLTGEELRHFIEFAKDHYPGIDPNRIYLVGASAGARTIAEYLGKFGGEDVAAAVPLVGDMTPAWEGKGCGLTREVALLGSHGGQDTNVLPAGDRESFARFERCPGRTRDVLFKYYPEAGHFDPAVWLLRANGSGDLDIYAWLLEQKKGHPETQPHQQIAMPAGAAH